MAKAPSGKPSWQSSSTKRANEIATEFKHDLRTIAESMANIEGAESVLTRHVDEAFSALRVLGLKRRRLRERPELLTSAGVILMGLAFAAPDVIDVFVDHPLLNRTLCLTAVTVLFFGGLCLWIFGWFRGSSPSTR